MPMTCSVGLTKKVGQPDYGSLGASCSVTFELDSSLLKTDLTAFQHQVRNAYVACTQAVHDELARQQSPRTSGTTVPASQPPSTNGNGSQGNGSPHRATDKQLEYTRTLASQIKGLGVRRLEAVSNQMFGKPVADLSTLDASGLIDSLKDIKSGKIDLASVLNEVES